MLVIAVVVTRGIMIGMVVTMFVLVSTLEMIVTGMVISNSFNLPRRRCRWGLCSGRTHLVA